MGVHYSRGGEAPPGGLGRTGMTGDGGAEGANLGDFVEKDWAGRPVELKRFLGSVVLVVNVASY